MQNVRYPFTRNIYTTSNFMHLQSPTGLSEKKNHFYYFEITDSEEENYRLNSFLTIIAQLHQAENLTTYSSEVVKMINYYITVNLNTALCATDFEEAPIIIISQLITQPITRNNCCFFFSVIVSCV